MSNATFFVRGCPICGRRLQVRVADLGNAVRCRHCRGMFVATEQANPHAPASTSSQPLMERVDELLSNSDISGGSFE